VLRIAGCVIGVLTVKKVMNRTALALGLVIAMTVASSHGQNGKPAPLSVTSPAFKEGEPIPSQYTCDGKDVSPPLHWDGAPPTTKAFAVICEDPDAPAGTWVHWMIYNIPASATTLPEGVKKGPASIDNGRQGVNDFGKIGYNGPCPPGGKAHRYFFKVYALDATAALPFLVKKPDFAKRIEGHIVAEGALMGTYQKQ
jgi:Raf kinase inhibitor-like YbhB/YbcL family protein